MPGRMNRLLSYQLVVLNRPTGTMHPTIIYLTGPTKKHRYSLKRLLADALSEARRAGVIDKYPAAVAVAGHFLRADLCACSDWAFGTIAGSKEEVDKRRRGELKRQVDAVRGTYATTTRPVIRSIGQANGGKGAKVSIIFVDTALLAPTGSSLKALGGSIGVEKIELPPGQIERMDELLRDDPALFGRYALNDAIIAAKYLDLTWSALEKNFAIGDHKPTLGSVGVEMIKREVANLGLTPDDYFGYRREGRKRHYHDALVDIWPFASNAYHGGRNEALWLGHTPEGVALYDLDLKGAYTTAMAMLRISDWASAAPETRIERLAVVDQAMTFARVRFEFSAATRFPSLPVRAAERGLVYPLRGTSWCTGPEIVVALKQGADLHVEAGWRVEWIEGSSSAFEAFSRSISRIRQQAKVDNDQLRNQLAKEIGNSAYGKIAQAVECSRTVHDGGVDAARGKRVFDSREGGMKTLPGSAITNPMFAATTTGLVRAAVSEMLANAPPEANICSVTTDGFLSSMSIDQVCQTGPVARAFEAARKRITSESPEILETKHVVGRALIVKTRGAITVAPFDADNPGEPVLARAGYKLENRPATEWEECPVWAKLHREREWNTFHKSKTLISLRTQWIEDADLVDEPRSTTVNLDFDMKRALVDPTDVEGVMTAATRPWASVEEFTACRDELESWKKAQRRVLKTVGDLDAMRAWLAARPGQKASGSTAQSPAPAARQRFPEGRNAGADRPGPVDAREPQSLLGALRLAGRSVDDQDVEAARKADAGRDRRSDSGGRPFRRSLLSRQPGRRPRPARRRRVCRRQGAEASRGSAVEQGRLTSSALIGCHWCVPRLCRGAP